MLRKLYSYNLAIALMRIGWLRNHIYKVNSLLLFFSSFIFIIIQYFLWKSIYESKEINYYSLNNMLAYIFIGEFISVFLYSNADNVISRLIRSGDIIHTMLKPVSLHYMIFFESLGNNIYRFVFSSVPILILSLFVLKVTSIFSLIMFLKFIILLLFSYIFIFLFELLIGLMSVLSINSWGITSFKFAVILILSGKLLPIDLYPYSFRNIVDFLPFKMMFYTPLNFIIKQESLNLIKTLSFETIWIIIFFLLNLILYKIVMKKISIQGG